MIHPTSPGTTGAGGSLRDRGVRTEPKYIRSYSNAVPAVEAPPARILLPIRELRKSDRASFISSILGGYGPFEDMIGMSRDGSAEFEALFQPGIWYLLRFLRIFGRAPLRAFVVVEADAVVGTTLLLPWPRSGYVLGVGVRPSHRRRGLAGRLVARAEDVARDGGRTWAVLDVEEENLPAIALYRARNYTTIQRTVWWRSEAPTRIATTAQVQPLSGRAERRQASEWVARQAPSELTSKLPPTANRLTHLESLGQSPGSAREVWEAGPAGSPHGVLSAIARGPTKPGILFVPAVGPDATRDEIVSLVQAGVGWLTGRGCAGVLVSVPDYMGPVASVLSDLGFSSQLTTLTMACPLPDGGAGRSPRGAVSGMNP